MAKLLGLFGIIVFFAAACGGSGATQASQPSRTPEATGTAGALLASSATAAPTATQAVIPTEAPPTSTPEPQPTAPPAPTQALAAPTAAPAPTTAPPPAAGPVTRAVSAQNLAFDQRTITVPANAQVTVNFTNNDVQVTHDFGVSIPFVPHTETCAGPCTGSIVFNSGAPATYTFQCSIHQDMVGDFIVQ